ncbi:hypothetical protein [Corynebacterium sp. 20_84]
MKRRITAAALAAATALSLSVAPAAEAQTADDFRDAAEILKFLGYVGDKGTGAMPDTEGAGEMAAGSVKAGSSGKDAYYVSQVSWGLLWTALAATGVGAIALAAQKAGLVKLPVNVPF